VHYLYPQRRILTLIKFYLKGGDSAGRHIFNRGSANGKRVQSNMGAKNHGVIMPDANKEYTINQVGCTRFEQQFDSIFNLELQGNHSKNN